jgi:hypothetical protein
MPTSPDESSLPGFLQQTEALELEAVPLQVALLTMEMAAIRARLTHLAALWEQMRDE